MSMSSILKAADNALDADEARVAAHILNTDILAMQRLAGRNSYTPDDVMRINRIMSEYAGIAKAEPAPRSPMTYGKKYGETA